ncbi:OLC1v1000024C2 [Oldenlandia corymbosa var. corymbosa]|uniref:OLC1v1000024C2 n=1 Tax=Oldenlandia corymbosa var. corymbosa TaxID=529605 RepID=A0AAV1D4R5_OLDCO|nr:OLC1v1000024C2 [Oldenlandia corymbosa var. corymbosa]
MTKKSQRRSLRHEKDHPGCISGLIHIFDFRNGRSTRKLLPDRRRANKHAVGTCSSHTRPMLTDCDDRSRNTEDDTDGGITSTDAVTTSVKKLMENEMCNDSNDLEVGTEKGSPEHSRGRQAKRNIRVSNKACKRSNETIDLCDLEAEKNLGSDKSRNQVGSKNASDRFDVEIIMHLLHDYFDRQTDQVSAVDKGKLSAAIEIFIDQSSSDSKHFIEDGQIQQSQEFQNALQKLSSNKDLLLQLFEDPKCQLSKQVNDLEGAKLRENLRSNSLPRSSFSEEKAAHSKADELTGHKPSRKFFRRRSKSQEHFPSIETENCQRSSKIVILKPGPTSLVPQDRENDVQSHAGRKIQEERSQFSFAEFKRKLKHAITRERQSTSEDGINHKTQLVHPKRHDLDKGSGGENLGWRSPNRKHFYVEKFAKPSISSKIGDKIAKPNGSEDIGATDKSNQAVPGNSNIYLEAKKHLIEMLNSSDYNTELRSQQLPKSLGRILSYSEYQYSPTSNNSPRKVDEEDVSVTVERSSSPHGGIEIVKEGVDQSSQENLTDHTSSFEHSSEIELCSTHISPSEEFDSSEANRGAAGFTEKTNNDLDDNEIHPGQSCSSYSKEEGVQFGDSDGELLEDRAIPSLDVETTEDCQTISPPLSPSSSSSSVAIKVEDLGDTSERTDRPSPVSVLEPLFVEDDISPARTLSKPVAQEIEPRKIQFEELKSSGDQGICSQTCLEDEESAFEYVEAVLLGSGLNWDDYLLRWLSSSSILESTLYDEVELFSSRSRDEQKLLFDCINEVLEEVCDYYFGSFPLSWHAKQNIRPVPMRMNLIHEIWEGVEWHLLQYPSPQSLDQLLKKDMAKSRTWMNLRLDFQHIGEEVEDIIVDDLIEDIISTFISDAPPTDLAS